MIRRILLVGALAAPVAWTASAAALAQQLAPIDPTLYQPQVDARDGGVLPESYNYHRQPYGQTSGRPGPYPPKDGWYGYGFPVSTYRWGWFGAERYYPRVGWRTDYNGDCVRWAYRYGY